MTPNATHYKPDPVYLRTLVAKSDIKELKESIGWQIKGLYAMNAIIMAWMGWMTSILLEVLKNLPK